MKAAVLIMASLPFLPNGCASQWPKPAPPPEPKAILLVTWLIPGQPPETTQTELSSMSSCEIARQAAIQAGENAKAERLRMNKQDWNEAEASLEEAQRAAKAQGIIITGASPEEERKFRGEPLPQVSAYCIKQ